MDYRKLARQKAKKYGLDPSIFERQIGAESGFNPNARSPMGAQGIAQIMPGTAKSWGVNPHDPAAALDAAAKNMAKYVKQYGGYENALRAYNAGPGAIKASRGYAETNAYVKKILQGRDPGKLGQTQQQPKKPGKPSSSGGGVLSPSTAITTTTGGEVKFDADGYEEARQRYVLAQFLAKRNPNSMLLKVLPQAAPSEAEFTSTSPTTTTTTTTEGSSIFERLTAGQEKSGKSSAPAPKATGALRPAGGFKGTKGPATELAKIAWDLGLKTTNTKRHNTNPYSGKNSDHDHGNKDAFAYDLSNGGAPTPEMDRAAFRIARKLGIKDYKMGTPINKFVTINGIRYQLIYRGKGRAFGGDHTNHIHLGAKRVG